MKKICLLTGVVVFILIGTAFAKVEYELSEKGDLLAYDLSGRDGQRGAAVSQTLDQYQSADRVVPRKRTSFEMPVERTSVPASPFQNSNSIKQQYVEQQTAPFVRQGADIDRKEVEVEVGHETYAYRYEETVSGGHFMDLEGQFYGLYGSLTYAPAEKSDFWGDFVDFYKVDARAAFGRLDYDGCVQTISGGTLPLSASGSENFVWELRGLLGKDYWFQNTYRLSPYVGIGYRRLRDNSSQLSGTVNGRNISGYDRFSHYAYIPVGVDIKQRLAGDWSIGMNLEYDQFVYGKQRSNITGVGIDVDTGDPVPYSVVNNEQYKGYGLRGSLRVEKALERISFLIEPFVRYWNIENSELAHFDKEETGNTDIDWVGGFIEPSNTTTEIGLKMGVMF